MRIKDLFCTRDEINNYIKSCLENGSAFIGGYSVVIPIGDNLVLKRYDDSAYKLFIKFVMNNQNSHCPVIYDHIFYEEFYPYGQGYVLMERLYPISDDKIATTNMNAESHGYWGKDDSVWMSLSESMDKFLKHLSDFGNKHSITWDLHDGNVMERKNEDGIVTLVVIDPWC